jgi:hypothetical protein
MGKRDISDYSPYERDAHGLACQFVSQQGENRNSPYFEALVALTRRIITTRAGLRTPVAHVGGVALNVVFETLDRDPLDDAVRQYLSKLATRETHESDALTDNGYASVTTYLLSARLGPLARLHYQMQLPDGPTLHDPRDVQYVMPVSGFDRETAMLPITPGNP